MHRIAISPEGNRIATAGNGPVEVHDLVKGDTLEVSSGGGRHGGVESRRRPAPRHRRRRPARRCGTPRPGPRSPSSGARASTRRRTPPRGTTVALTSVDETSVTLWDPTRDARRAKELEGHTDAPGAVAWSPDGAVVYAVAADDGVLAWDAATGERAPTDFEVPAGPLGAPGFVDRVHPSRSLDAVIRFEKVTKTYPGHPHPALDNVSVDVEKGEFVFLVGSSGSGKSTFLRLVLREYRPTTGSRLRRRQGDQPARRLEGAAAAPRHRHRLPGLPAAAQQDRDRERRLRAPGDRQVPQGDQGRRPRDARAGRA